MNAVSPRSSASADFALAYLPIFLAVRDRPVLLIGNGDAARAKLDLLLRAGADVRRIVPDAAPLCAAHFAGVVLAIDASGDPALRRQSVQLAREVGVPLNVVDHPGACDFILPAIVDRSPIIVAISTGGLAPVIARLIRQRLESAIPVGIGHLALLAARFRRGIATRLPSARQRALFWERLFEGPAAALAVAGQLDDATALAETLVAETMAEPEAASCSTLLVSSDDPDLLTVRAARLIRMADVILHDPVIGQPILDLGRREAQRIALPYPCSDTFRRGLLRDHARRGMSCVYLTTERVVAARSGRGAVVAQPAEELCPAGR